MSNQEAPDGVDLETWLARSTGQACTYRDSGAIEPCSRIVGVPSLGVCDTHLVWLENLLSLTENNSGGGLCNNCGAHDAPISVRKMGRSTSPRRSRSVLWCAPCFQRECCGGIDLFVYVRPG